MAQPIAARRSIAHIILAQIRHEIMSLEIRPGAKLSETEVAARFGVSRQPVREALNLLSGEGLVSIQPQRATRVRQFSLKKIEAARFVRRAIEIEVLRIACANWSDTYRPKFQSCIDAQARAAHVQDANGFHQLDEEFHTLLTELAGVPFVMDEIRAQKAHVDRICVLSLQDASEMAKIVEDHQLIFECLAAQDFPRGEAALRVHLSRIERTIDAVRHTHAGYFED